jgi:excisionase family DNA binding protein
MTTTNVQREKLESLFTAMVEVADLVLREVRARHPVSMAAPSALVQPPPRATEPNDNRLWTVADVARFLGASKSWVYKPAEKGTLPAIRLGALLRFEAEAMRRFAGLEGGVVSTGAPR